MKKYILFDLDGTLTDPKEGITKSVQYALEKYGIHEKCDNLIEFIGPPLKDSFAEFYGFDDAKCDEAIAFYRERFSTIGLFENRVYPGVINSLKKLKQEGRILAIATSKPTVFTMRICDKFGLTPYFDIIVGSELDGRNTRKCDVINKVIKELGCNVCDAIMVGDRKHDIIGAKLCGMESIGVRCGYAVGNELVEAGADYVIDDISKIEDLKI